jgi:hypothetical protein
MLITVIEVTSLQTYFYQNTDAFRLYADCTQEVLEQAITKSLMGRIAIIINYTFHINFLSFTSPSIVNDLQHGGKLYVRAQLTLKRVVFYASSVFLTILRNAYEFYFL